MIDDQKQAFAAAVQTAVLLLDKTYFGRCVAWMRIVATACNISDEVFKKLMAESGDNIADAAYLYVMTFCKDFQPRKYPEDECRVQPLGVKAGEKYPMADGGVSAARLVKQLQGEVSVLVFRAEQAERDFKAALAQNADLEQRRQNAASAEVNKSNDAANWQKRAEKAEQELRIANNLIKRYDETEHRLRNALDSFSMMKVKISNALEGK